MASNVVSRWEERWARTVIVGMLSPPDGVSDWFQDRASIPAQAAYEARWGVNYMSGGGLPLDWFDHD